MSDKLLQIEVVSASQPFDVSGEGGGQLTQNLCFICYSFGCIETINYLSTCTIPKCSDNIAKIVPHSLRAPKGVRKARMGLIDSF